MISEMSKMNMMIDFFEEINEMNKKAESDEFKELKEKAMKREITITVYDIMEALSEEMTEYFVAVDDEMDIALKIYMLDIISTVVANMTHRLEAKSEERNKNDRK